MVRITRVRDEFYSENGLRSFAIRFKNVNGSYRTLAGKTFSLALQDNLGKETYKFTTEATGANRLAVVSDSISDKLVFPEIKSWKMAPGVHSGDVKEVDATGYLEILQTLEFPFNKNV